MPPDKRVLGDPLATVHKACTVRAWHVNAWKYSVLGAGSTTLVALPGMPLAQHILILLVSFGLWELGSFEHLYTDK